jgi:hypothetical protein
MADLASMVEAYLAGPDALRQAVAGLSREQLLARPVPGKWSTLEVVCHIADFEPILADRMKRIISHDRPMLLGADENRFAATLAYHQRDVNEELELIALTRRQLGRILRGLPDAAGDRVGVHSERGELKLTDLLASATRHIPHHVGFIAEKRKALGA